MIFLLIKGEKIRIITVKCSRGQIAFKHLTDSAYHI